MTRLGTCPSCGQPFGEPPPGYALVWAVHLCGGAGTYRPPPRPTRAELEAAIAAARAEKPPAAPKPAPKPTPEPPPQLGLFLGDS